MTTIPTCECKIGDRRVSRQQLIATNMGRIELLRCTCGYALIKKISYPRRGTTWECPNNEANIMARLNHPNIATMYNSVYNNGIRTSYLQYYAGM
jgi:hypothetical protein